MKVLDVTTKNTLESENEFVIEQWKKLPERYKPQKDKPPSVDKPPGDNNGKSPDKGKQDEQPAKGAS